jgi:hypothetical protein
MEQKYKNIFSFVLVPLIVLSVGASYYQFMVQKNFLVTFEGYCDPEEESCYWGEYEDACEYDESKMCWYDYHYRFVEKPFSTYESQMSECSEPTFFEETEEGDLVFLDPSYCEAVDTCEPDEKNCTIEYCDDSNSENECNINYEY